MWSSAMHFVIGFFGYPFEGQYEQSITIEHDGVSLQSLFVIPTNICHCQFNNTLAPYKAYVAYNLSTRQFLTLPFSVAPTGNTLTILNVPLGMSVVGPRGRFEPLPLLLCDTIDPRADTSRMPGNVSTPNYMALN